MAKILVDGVEYDVDPENNLLQECLSQGLDLPYFCWHPCMGSVGACRQCAVKQYRDEEDEKGMIVMACMTPAADGSRISITDAQARLMREQVIESLMINHPHDCPVCEEGGECHLQDMTVMSGHNYRRYDKKKRTHQNQYLGPFINHEMNRCIACYRCVRYYDDYAGGTDLSAQASHHHVYFGRYEEGVLESEFSGNLVEVCPTGVFTDRVFSAHYTRKWDLQSAPSVCTGCGVGCNTTPGERYGTLRRIVNRYNSDVNGYFLCDRGRFGFEYVNSGERLSEPQVRVKGQTEAMAPEHIPSVLQQFTGDVIGIGSPRASNEGNFALQHLVGEENFYAGVADGEHAINQLILQLARDPAFHNPSIREIEQADAIIILGEDVTNVAPRVALALRQSVRNEARALAEKNKIPQWHDAAVRELAQHDRSPLSILSSYATRLDDIAEDSVIDGPAGLVQLAHAIAHRLNDEAADAEALEPAHSDAAGKIAAQLKGARRPLVIAGSASGSLELLQAASNIARALQSGRDTPVDFCTLVPEANTLGLTLLAREENSLGAALERIAAGKASKLIVLENDLYRRAAPAQVDAALGKLESLLVLDLMPTATTEKADYVLPVTAFSEQESTTVNYEGRAQLSFQVHQSASTARPAWLWLTPDNISRVDDLIELCSAQLARFGKLDDLLPDVSQFVSGMKVPRQSHRYSGRTAMRANINVHEGRQPQDDQSLLAFSMEGVSPLKNAAILGQAWAPGWNSNQSISKFQEEVNGELKQGHTGELLIARDGERLSYFPAPTAKSASGDGLELALAHQIFGSDELSARSEAIQQRMTGAYVSLAPSDAERLSLKQGDRVSLDGNGGLATVCIRKKMKPGTAAVYCGDNEINPHALEARVSLSKVDGESPVRALDGLIVSDLYEEAY
ncbi:MAG: NADH-quinone oxidoreductase subunit NuoG [Pseudohongiellaceae bacterium]